MKTVAVNTGVPYTIYIENGILDKVGAYAQKLTKAQTAVLVTDDIVDALYAERAEQSLKEAGFQTLKFVFPNGEASKNLRVYGEILEFLAEHRVTRTDCIVALGGGVVGDMAGFAAATYQRGIDFVQVPTTLLSCVDSSVGGKTAVDLSAGKNLVGAFYQPRAVLCDPDTLHTLSDRIFADGMAEVIKYGAIFSREFFDFLAQNDAKENIETVIERCVTFKRDVVEKDERDLGLRGLLNFGHTLGHAVEACSHFSVSHGSAVAIGMVLAARGAYRCGLTNANCTEEITCILKKYHLPTETEFSAAELYSHALSDKKRDGRKITLIVPRTLGECVLYKTDTEELARVIEAGVTE